MGHELKEKASNIQKKFEASNKKTLLNDTPPGKKIPRCEGSKVRSEWKRTQNPLMMFLGRRERIAFFNQFDNKKGNYNISYNAPTGSGMSFLTFVNDTEQTKSEVNNCKSLCSDSSSEETEHSELTCTLKIKSPSNAIDRQHDLTSGRYIYLKVGGSKWDMN